MLKTKTSEGVALRPLQDRLVVKREESPDRQGSILLPDTAKQRVNRGRVLAVGEGKLLDDGTLGRMLVQEGQVVVFSSYAGHEVEYDGEDYLILVQADCLCVIE